MPIYSTMRMEAQGQPSYSGSSLPAIHLKSQAITEREGTAMVIATMNLTRKPTRMRIIGSHVLLIGSGHPRLAIAQRRRSVSTIFRRGLPANVDLIGPVRSRTPLLIRIRGPPRSPIPRVDCLRRRYLHYKSWIQRCHQIPVYDSKEQKTSRDC
jgi:hypothetical protein